MRPHLYLHLYDTKPITRSFSRAFHRPLDCPNRTIFKEAMIITVNRNNCTGLNSRAGMGYPGTRVPASL